MLASLVLKKAGWLAACVKYMSNLDIIHILSIHRIFAVWSSEATPQACEANRRGRRLCPFWRSIVFVIPKIIDIRQRNGQYRQWQWQWN